MLDDPASVATLARQFAMKNTMGYGLNALVDFDTAPEMLAHLVVGSEGTLAFVASATFRTVPLRTHAASALLVFDDLYAANRALPALVATGAATLELMDATSLRVGQTLADCPAAVGALTVERQAALLVEYQATTADELRVARGRGAAGAGRRAARPPTPAPATSSGSCARGCTPPWPARGAAGPPRCWRTSSSRWSGWRTRAPRSRRCSAGTPTRTR